MRSENGEILANTQKQFIWDGSHLVQEINHKTNRTYCYIYSHPNSYEPLAQLVFAKNSKNPTACYYYHNDQIGVPRELTDENGKLCWYGDYTGWGKLKDEYALVENIHQPFRLQNQYADEETGLHYNFFRYYEPNIGRFTQLDPIGLAGGENLYRFEGNIQNQTDPLGLFAPAAGYAGYMLWGMLFGTIHGTMEAMEESKQSSESSASKTECSGKCKPKCPDDEFKKLTDDVNSAKKEAGQLGGCKKGMGSYDINIRSKAWKQLALARSIRENKCWDGGDYNHQNEIAKAWANYYKCEGMR